MATAAAATKTISQISCFSSINRRFQLYHRSTFRPVTRSKSFVVTSVDGHGAETTGNQPKTTPSYIAGESKAFIEDMPRTYPNAEEHVPENTSDLEEEHGIIQQKRAAKIHDFCFGIPYGGLVLSGGLIGFIFSRNTTTLLFGGALLALSTFSLKIWRQGKSSLLFILGQAEYSSTSVYLFSTGGMHFVEVQMFNKDGSNTYSYHANIISSSPFLDELSDLLIDKEAIS
ncbi:hypothetical protein ERO13_D03G073000v2 [Gossypium hirsutum]|uniref:Protein FATTY ACID EXPORT 1, chloroplastic isoform X2 n=1 Tax=Gossypium hirsutum TaxID=3635 RepID=A0A1U8NNK1_GOSHI|nr:protein FATTY ACID EXPORT 1, chloroplastic isoform X2 [Gossypium hirsutum]KAG4154820.1 hypothetical protein ERO13_D03G073000v2 [Gossypium hirsutum]